MGRGGFSHESNVTEAASFVYKYLYDKRVVTLRHLEAPAASHTRFPQPSTTRIPIPVTRNLY